MLLFLCLATTSSFFGFLILLRRFFFNKGCSANSFAAVFLSTVSQKISATSSSSSSNAFVFWFHLLLTDPFSKRKRKIFTQAFVHGFSFSPLAGCCTFTQFSRSGLGYWQLEVTRCVPKTFAGPQIYTSCATIIRVQYRKEKKRKMVAPEKKGTGKHSHALFDWRNYKHPDSPRGKLCSDRFSFLV